jgi:hypothetical protein
MSKVLTVMALSLLATTAANAMSGRPHSTYHAAAVSNHQTQKDASDPAAPPAAPEIDPGSAISAFTLLAGGLAVIRGRRAASKRD